MIQEEISDVNMEFFISGLDIALILNQNNYPVKKCADLRESISFVWYIWQQPNYFLFQSRAVKDKSNSVESKWLRCNLVNNVMNRKVIHSRSDSEVL